MEGFKPFKKVQCFKEGGSVKYESRKEHKEEMSSDIKQDKAIVKKAFAMHDKQEHKGEKTDLAGLKKGGRTKKAVGTVNRYKTGGSVTNVYEAKKASGDISNIKKVKDIKPGKAAAPSGAKGPDAFKCGGKVKKMADGRLVESLANAGNAGGLGAVMQNRARDKYREKMRLDPTQQRELEAQQAAASAKAALGSQFSNAEADRFNKVSEGIGRPNVDQMGNPTGMKKGGKACK